MPDLIEDADGAPLPPELQPGGVVHAAVFAHFDYDVPQSLDEDERDDNVTDMLIRLAPVLWPWLPSNNRRTDGVVDGIRPHRQLTEAEATQARALNAAMPTWTDEPLPLEGV